MRWVVEGVIDWVSLDVADGVGGSGGDRWNR